MTKKIVSIVYQPFGIHTEVTLGIRYGLTFATIQTTIEEHWLSELALIDIVLEKIGADKEQFDLSKFKPELQ